MEGEHTKRPDFFYHRAEFPLHWSDFLADREWLKKQTKSSNEEHQKKEGSKNSMTDAEKQNCNIKLQIGLLHTGLISLDNFLGDLTCPGPKA